MKGFTLIELMVSVTIMAILLGVGVVSLNNFNNSQKVETTKNELISSLKLARNYAITMQLPNGVSGTLNYVQVDLKTNGQISVDAYGILDGQNTTMNIGPYFSKDISPIGVDITVTNIINFASYKGDLVYPNYPVSIIISSSEDPDDAAKSILIDSSGLIK
ncbi:MAG: prepilin-type N-terminal cleavage/methylation domain-containing protein [Candidatus Shapirobacteria bacterium]